MIYRQIFKTEIERNASQLTRIYILSSLLDYLRFEFVVEIPKCDYSNERYLTILSSVVLFITLCEVVLTFEFVDEILKRCHSTENTQLVILLGTLLFSSCFPSRTI